jgi:thiol-disulfide isomerase/thioredoxin
MLKWLHLVIVPLMASSLTFAGQKPQKADDVVKVAKAKASEQNKVIFLIFAASWCEACHQLDAFMQLPEVASVFEKYFIIAKVNVGEENGEHPQLNNPGSEELLMKYGGVSPGAEATIPFMAMLDQKAKLIVNSNKPGKKKPSDAGTGFPSEPDEISWFLEMLKKAAPAITPEETRIVQAGLRKIAQE